MKTYVCIKQVPDTESRLQIKADKSGIEETGVKWVMNPYDEYAVEEALKLRDAKGGSVTVVSIGPKSRVTEALRTAMAMGADDAIVVDTAQYLDQFWTAKALAGAIRKEGAADMVFTGKLAIDDNAASVPQMLAELLQVPHVTVATKFTADASSYVVEREVEGGAREVFEVKGPCVIAANKGLNTPRYASLPGIMKAKKKPLKELTLADVGVTDGAAKVRLKDFQLPADKPAVKMITGDAAQQAKELVRLVLEEAKVL